MLPGWIVQQPTSFTSALFNRYWNFWFLVVVQVYLYLTEKLQNGFESNFRERLSMACFLFFLIVSDVRWFLLAVRKEVRNNNCSYHSDWSMVNRNIGHGMNHYRVRWWYYRWWFDVRTSPEQGAKATLTIGLTRERTKWCALPMINRAGNAFRSITIWQGTVVSN